MKRLLVLFLGNILRGDDGVGIELFKRISRRELPENVVLKEGSTGGMILLGLLEDYDRVLIVDAVDTGDINKDVIIFSPKDILESDGDRLSLHSLSINDIVKFNQLLGERIPEIIIFGIQVDDISEHIGLSPKILNSIDKIEERLYKEILHYSDH
ncbi:MAG: hydrogenase maturation protease [Myxococcota bacterium]